MTHTNIFAYTEFEYKLYPAYLSLNKMDDGRVVLSVRTRDGSSSSEIELPDEELCGLAESSLSFLQQRRRERT